MTHLQESDGISVHPELHRTRIIVEVATVQSSDGWAACLWLDGEPDSACSIRSQETREASLAALERDIAAEVMFRA